MTKFPPFLRVLFLVAFIASVLFIGLSDNDRAIEPMKDSGLQQSKSVVSGGSPVAEERAQKDSISSSDNNNTDTEVMSLRDDVVTSNVERDTEITLSSDAVDASNNIVNAILDTLSGEITDIDIDSSGGRGKLTVNLQWQSNLDTLERDLRQSFAFKKSARVQQDGFHHALYSVTEPSESDPSYDVFQALLENKISLIVKAGEHEKLITIATGLRDQSDDLEYVMLPSKSDSRSSLIIEKEMTPIVIDDIPLDEAKLLREVVLGITLKRLDTGLTFNILLDKKEL